MTVLVVLANVVLIRGEDPCSRIEHVDLENCEAGGVAGGVAEGEALEEFDGVASPGLPVDLEVEVVGEVDA